MKTKQSTCEKDDDTCSKKLHLSSPQEIENVEVLGFSNKYQLKQSYASLLITEYAQIIAFSFQRIWRLASQPISQVLVSLADRQVRKR